MKIGIIGSGSIGGNLARLLIKVGHEVALTNSRGPESLHIFADELGEKLHPVTLQEAVDFGEIVIVAIHWRSLDKLPVFHAPGKIIIDTTNPYKSDGTLFNLGEDFSSSKVVEHFPNAKVVKAFNTIWYKHLAENGNTSIPVDKRRAIPLAGDDAGAKQIVATLIEQLGFGPMDTGSLKEGSKFQGAEGILYGKELTLIEAEAVIKSTLLNKVK